MNIRHVTDLFDEAKRSGRTWVLSVAAPYEPDVLDAIRLASEGGFVKAILFGNEERIRAAAQQAALPLGSAIELVPSENDRETVRAATDCVQEGRAQILVKGLVPTSALFRAVLSKEFGLRSDRLLSHVAVFNCPMTGRLMFLTDAGINIAPNVHRKVQIVRNAVDVARRLGVEQPRVALLAAVDTLNYPAMQATLDAALVSRIARSGVVPNAIIEGPFALDNAVSELAAKKKKRGGRVAGHADILCAPEIETANVLYKALQSFCGSTLAGAVVGARSPIAVPSRADTAESKLMSIALACLLAD